MDFTEIVEIKNENLDTDEYSEDNSAVEEPETVYYTIKEISEIELDGGNWESDQQPIHNNEEESTNKPWITYCLPDFVPESSMEIGPDLTIRPKESSSKFQMVKKLKNVCLICKMSYSSHYALAKHNGKIHSYSDFLLRIKSRKLQEMLQKYKCLACNIPTCFLNSIDLENHRLIHFGTYNVIVKCSVCTASFGDALHVKSHICPNLLDDILWKKENEETIVNQQLYRCAECNSTFISLSQVKEHTCEIPNEEILANNGLDHNQQLFKCGDCSKTFGSILDVKNHTCISNLQSETANYVKEDCSYSVMPNSACQRVAIKCPRCPEKFMKELFFHEHIKIIHSGEVIKEGENNFRIILDSNKTKESEKLVEADVNDPQSQSSSDYWVSTDVVQEIDDTSNDFDSHVKLEVEDYSTSESNNQDASTSIEENNFESNAIENEKSNKIKIGKFQEIFKCCKCLLAYSNMRDLKLHMSSHEAESGNAAEVDQTEISFLTIQVTDRHPVEFILQENLMTCSLCRLTFSGFTDIHTHLATSYCGSSQPEEILTSKKRKTIGE